MGILVDEGAEMRTAMRTEGDGDRRVLTGDDWDELQ